MATPPPNPLRVLVVDDRRDVTFLLKTLLSRQGFEVFTAANGADGLEAVRKHAPGAVISDLSLGDDMDGCAMVSAVRNDPLLAVPCFIAITGFDDEEHRWLAREAGFDHYLVKPPPMNQLLALLSNLDADSQPLAEGGA